MKGRSLKLQRNIRASDGPEFGLRRGKIKGRLTFDKRDRKPRGTKSL